MTFAAHKSLKTQESQFGVDIDHLTAEQPAASVGNSNCRCASAVRRTSFLAEDSLRWPRACESIYIPGSVEAGCLLLLTGVLGMKEYLPLFGLHDDISISYFSFAGIKHCDQVS